MILNWWPEPWHVQLTHQIADQKINLLHRNFNSWRILLKCWQKSLDCCKGTELLHLLQERTNFSFYLKAATTSVGGPAILLSTCFGDRQWWLLLWTQSAWRSRSSEPGRGCINLMLISVQQKKDQFSYYIRKQSISWLQSYEQPESMRCKKIIMLLEE